MAGFTEWMWLAGALLLGAAAMRDMLWLRTGMGAAAFVAALGAGLAGDWPVLAAAATLLLVSLFHILTLVDWTGARLSEEEVELRNAVFPTMPRGLVRQLLHQGHWIDGRAGEMLTREGEPVSHLFYLSRGEARVETGGRAVATCRPGNFIGELTVLEGGPATATVILENDARFWCVTAQNLRLFLEANRSLMPLVEQAFAGNVREKLVLANQRLAAG